VSPDDAAVSIPVWVIASVIVPLAIGVLELLRRLGLRELARWQSRVSEVEDHLEALEDQMSDEHEGVAQEVGDLQEEIRALRRELER
jgi:HAMP domain-containing protein